MRRRVALVSVVASAACFGTLGVLANLAYARGVAPLPMLAWRFLLVTVLTILAFMGLGLIFYGMAAMGSAMAPFIYTLF